MGKLKNIEILFDGNKKVYLPGETISGNVILESKGEVKINSLKLFIRGLAKVHWTETSSVGFKVGNRTEHYRAEKEYFCFKQNLIGQEDSSGSHYQEIICDGHHLFSFQFDLPREGLITSFEGEHGSVRYLVQIELDKPWALNQRLKRIFTVINPLDINQSDYLQPVLNNCSKTLCCWLCRSGPVSISVNTDRKGYCPGESIALNALFENYTKRSTIPIASLYQIQTFKANQEKSISKNKISSINGPAVEAGEIAEWNSKLLKIPVISPSIQSHLIKVEYFVKICLLIPGSYTLKCVLPIVIGTVPFRRYLHESINYSYVPAEPTRIRIDAPPSYSQLRDLDENHDEEISNYAPLYTYVSDYQPPSYSSLKNLSKPN
ncbi:unnamed protein product [Brachionus calyciflorus]|uniref:Arrestin C-terminal-like domain-containing protein n=1 Tax=Brachionus calyciflorus TaxID=104777 RepID=A0A813M9C4_9BILA|nr:unnamed protein product [Brachionus calyciflorus]